MSFSALDVDLESQKSFSDSPEFDNFANECSNALLTVNNNLVTLNKFIKTLESSKSIEATDKVNGRILKLIDTITGLFKEISGSSKKLTDFNELNQTKEFIKEKITREIKTSLTEFQQLQEKYTIATEKLNQEAKNALIEDQIQENNTIGTANQELILEQDVINNEEFTYQQNLIREREEEIQNIEQGIQELNEIFGDLGAIVQAQGTMVDNIESNIHDIAGNTRAAASELTRALNYQRRSKRRSFCFFLVLVIVLLVVILGIVL